MAVGAGISALAFHMTEQGRTDYGELIGRFKMTTDAWKEDGGENWDKLRASLRHEWTDHELAR